MHPRVELVYDGDCPNVGAARAQLLRAFAEVGLPARWREWRADAPMAPQRVRGLGSPSVLVNGRDVVPLTSQAACCRVYAGDSGGLAGVPPLVDLVGALRADVPSKGGWRDAGLWLPALGLAALPKLVCPACWPAYAALVSAAGLGFLMETRFLLPITLAALALVLGLLAWRAPRRRGYGPLALGVVASGLILWAKFGLVSLPLVYAGAGLLFAACVWNAWPRRVVVQSCPACPPDVSLPRRSHEYPTQD